MWLLIHTGFLKGEAINEPSTTLFHAQICKVVNL